MGRFVIVTGIIAGGGRVLDLYAPRESDFVAAVDRGIELAADCDIRPDLVIGDFDSADINLVDCGNAEIIKLPTEKADTDTFAAAKHGIKLGYKDFLILGGLSGRLDHTIANIQTLALLASEGCRAEIIDNKNRLKILMPGEIAFVEDSERYFSVYSFEREAVVTIKNAKWDLDMARLINRFPVGTSNEPLSPRSEVLCENGLVLVVISKD